MRAVNTGNVLGRRLEGKASGGSNRDSEDETIRVRGRGSARGDEREARGYSGE